VKETTLEKLQRVKVENARFDARHNRLTGETMNKVKYASGDGCRSLVFVCPGCESAHAVPVEGDGSKWQFNGDLEKPTLSPSLLIRTGHYAGYFDDDGDICWCKYNADHPEDKAPFTCGVCHSFIRDGKIEFLSDCTHKLAGQTVELFELEKTTP